MKQLKITMLFLILAGLIAGCGPKQAPIVDMSQPQEQAQQIKTIQNDPNMSPAMKAAYVSQLSRVGTPNGVASPGAGATSPSGGGAASSAAPNGGNGVAAPGTGAK